jgi:hypothetical protein
MSVSLAEPTRELSGASTPPPDSDGLSMLDLPEAGHRRALRWMIAGMAAYLLLGSILLLSLNQADRAAARTQAPIGGTAGIDTSGTSLLSLVGLGPNRNLAITVLVLAGIALTLVSAGYVWKDIKRLEAEEGDIEFVRKTEGRRLDLVFYDDAVRSRLVRSAEPVQSSRKGRVESLLDDRVRRVLAARMSGSASVSVEELRNVAEKRSSQFGSFARYASSLLLLLAVLGTFAGVKTALPWLVQAVSSSTSDTAALSQPLQAIAAAFGGNALALVGAIAVGLMAQGVAFGRQNMLERLELVSAEFVYGNETANASDPMQAAIQALSRTSNEFQSASGALLGIEAGLNDLGDQFQASLNGLGDRLGDIANRQETNLYDKTGATLEALQLRVGELTKSVEANAHAYAGLVASIRDRTEETRAAIGHMENANVQLARGIEGLLGAGQRAQETFTQARQSFDTMESAATRLADDSGTAKAAVADLNTLVGSLKNSADTMAAGVDTIAQRLAAAESRADRAVGELGLQLSTKIDAVAARSSSPPAVATTAPTGGGQESAAMLAALRQIAAGIDEIRSAPRPALWMQLLVPGVAASLCVGLAYGLMQLLR